MFKPQNTIISELLAKKQLPRASLDTLYVHAKKIQNSFLFCDFMRQATWCPSSRAPTSCISQPVLRSPGYSTTCRAKGRTRETATALLVYFEVLPQGLLALPPHSPTPRCHVQQAPEYSTTYIQRGPGPVYAGMCSRALIPLSD